MTKICMKRKKLKNELRSIQKKYSFLPQSGKRKAKGGHTALYKATLENLELKDVKMIYKGDFNTKGNTGVQELFLIIIIISISQ